MDSSHLNEEQRRALMYAAADRRDYFYRLRRRMESRGFRLDDPLYVAVCAAWDACQAVVKLAAPEKDEPAPEGLPAWVTRRDVEPP